MKTGFSVPVIREETEGSSQLSLTLYSIETKFLVLLSSPRLQQSR